MIKPHCIGQKNWNDQNVKKTKGQVCMHQLYLLEILFMLVFTGRKNSSKYTFVYIQRTTDHRIWIFPLGIFSSSSLYFKAVGAE